MENSVETRNLRPTPQEDVPERSTVRMFASRLASASGWMTFLAVLGIVSAVLSLFGGLLNLLWVWVPVWSSVVLFQAAGRLRDAADTGGAATFSDALGKLSLYFKIAGVVSTIGIVLAVIGLITAFSLRPSFY